MTSIGVTNRTGSYNRSSEAHDWKRRAERLVRESGMPYTIVRPGRFDYNNAPNQHRLLFLQGDKRQAGDSSDGVIARTQIAQVLSHSLTSDQALRKTFELVAIEGPAQHDLDALFASLDAYNADPGAQLPRNARPKNGLAPGDPARMAARIIGSVDVEPAPLKIVLDSQALEGTLTTLRNRIASFEAQEELAGSTDFPPGE